MNGVSKRLGDREVLRGVSLRAEKGELVTIIGPSGGGKSTLFRCILGELAPDDGSVAIDGQDVTRLPIEKRNIGTVYQTYALFPHMTVAENIAYGLRVRRASRADIDRRVKEMLALVRLEDRANALPHRLSGGESQRVALARAVAVEPRALLLDEAFTALDATTRHAVVQEVRQIIRQLKLTTLLITHDQEEAFIFARRVLVLNEGHVVASGDPESIMANPHPFIRDFVKMLLFQKARIERMGDGATYAALENGTRIPITLPEAHEGDIVHVMVKKGPERQSIQVLPFDPF